MPRPQRCRWIGSYPDYWSFAPQDAEEEAPVTMTLDEFETIRLIDRQGLTQEQCAQEMGVARTTVTAIYESARRKLAESLIDGKTLRIAGGSYQLRGQQEIDVPLKGADMMRIAVTYEDGQIFQHFGHTEQFKLYDVAGGKITDTRVMNTNGTGHGALAGFLKMAEVDALICGGIGMGAQNALAEAGIILLAGAQGDADAAVQALIDGTLEYSEEATCDHHGHGDHDCGHGDHECGSHGCGEGCH